MLRVDLRSPIMNERFAMAPIYRKSCTVQAIQATKEGLETGAYADLGVHPNSNNDGYIVDIYVMREKDGKRVAEMEAPQPVNVGDWIITNPKHHSDDYLNIYAQPDEKFRKRYEPVDQEGHYQAKGMTRIIPNLTGEAVVVTAYWGDDQVGDKDCYFCAPYDPERPDDLAEDGRYILDRNDFEHTYRLVEK